MEKWYQVELSEEELRIKGDLYGKTIPIRALICDRATQINLSHSSLFR
jgi:hypothetical protein